MANKKQEIFSSSDQDIALISKALSHPARVQIIKILTEKVVCVCGEIVELLPLSQSTVSQHLKELKNAGIIIGEIDGPRTCYCIDYDKLLFYKNLMENFFNLINQNNRSVKMLKSEEIKEVVKKKYSEIAGESTNCGCGCNCSSDQILTYVMSDSYQNIEGHLPEANLNLGCGIPTEFANIKEGYTVLDLGSGAGNDVFVTRNIVGENGFVIGVDMTEEMIAKAEKNKTKTGYTNIEFRLGDIEKLPVNDNSIDVVISNCVLNLVPDKRKAFKEIYRVLKSGQHFCVSDIVIRGELPYKIQCSLELYTGCISGAISIDEYTNIIKESGFSNIQIKKEKQISVNETTLSSLLNQDEIRRYKDSNSGIFSVTVYGVK